MGNTTSTLVENKNDQEKGSSRSPFSQWALLERFFASPDVHTVNKLREISENPDLIRNPPQSLSFTIGCHFDNEYARVARRLLDLDPHLAVVRKNMVPGRRLCEDSFWRNYFFLLSHSFYDEINMLRFPLFMNPTLQSHSYHKELLLAEMVVTRAMMVAEKVFHDLVADDAVSKTDSSPVTVADYVVQYIILSQLMREFPGDSILAEEDASLLINRDHKYILKKVVEVASSTNFPHGDFSEDDVLHNIDSGQCCDTSDGRIWVLDPIDGTMGFLNGRQYAVCLALLVDGIVQVAVLGCPKLEFSNDSNKGLSKEDFSRGCLLSAVENGGAYERRFVDNFSVARPLSVSKVFDVSKAKLCESFEVSHTSQMLSKNLCNSLEIINSPLRIDSQVKYSMVARGDASIYIRIPVESESRENVWDHAAGTLIVKESGGTVTDLDGKSLNFRQGRKLVSNRGILATNGLIHQTVVDGISQF